MSNHTPGPWLIGRGADGLPIVHTTPDASSPSGQGIAHVCKRPMCHDHVANAALIAAAPDMLATLWDIAVMFDRNELAHQTCDVGKIIRGVIAKANGKVATS